MSHGLSQDEKNELNSEHYTTKIPMGWEPNKQSLNAYLEDLEMWLEYTELLPDNPGKVGIAIAMRLKGKARAVAFDLGRPTLKRKGSETEAPGYRLLIDKLREQFGEYDADLAYAEMKAFIRLRRTAGRDLKDFIAEWEVAKNRAESNGFELGGTSDSFFLLEALGITDQQRSLVLAATAGSFELKLITQQVKRLFATSLRTDMTALYAGFDDEEPAEEAIESEYEVDEDGRDEFEAFWTMRNSAEAGLANFRSSKGKGKGKGKVHRKSQSTKRWDNAVHANTDEEPGTNPIDRRTKERMRCSTCGSKYHLRAECPKKPEARQDHAVKINIHEIDPEHMVWMHSCEKEPHTPVDDDSCSCTCTTPGQTEIFETMDGQRMTVCSVRLGRAGTLDQSSGHSGS